MTITLEQALDHPGERLAVWDISGPEEQLVVYAVHDGRLERLVTATVPKSGRDQRAADLRRRGIRIGVSDMPGPFVWSTDGGLTVWSLIKPYGVVAEGDRDLVKTRGGARIRRADVAEVISFFDDDSPGHRGVKVVTRSGVEIAVVEEDSPAAKLDPTYGIDHVMVEGAWATFCGRDLAAWLGVPHTDELP
jgi:hypothetical protein